VLLGFVQVARVSRFFDWFWLESAERAAREQGGKPSGRALELVGRAALATEAAERTERPAEPFLRAGSEAVAAELHRQAIHWALLAHAEIASSGAAAPAAADTSLAQLLERTERALLVRAAGSEAELDAVRPRLLESYREYAELEPSARRSLVADLGRVSQGLLEPLAGVQERLERIWVRRLAHVLAVLVVLIGVGVGARQVSRARELGSDLAPHAAWTTSSRYAVGGCKSPLQRCDGGENYFFHTEREANPWIKFDLGKERKVSSVGVENRLDCCTERAMPIVIETSNDGASWKEVARQNEEFTSVRLRFRTTKARYVRVRLASPSSILHLSRVQIFP
jgi:hypothetical protein